MPKTFNKLSEFVNLGFAIFVDSAMVKQFECKWLQCCWPSMAQPHFLHAKTQNWNDTVVQWLLLNNLAEPWQFPSNLDQKFQTLFSCPAHVCEPRRCFDRQASRAGASGILSRIKNFWSQTKTMRHLESWTKKTTHTSAHRKVKCHQSRFLSRPFLKWKKKQRRRKKKKQEERRRNKKLWDVK